MDEHNLKILIRKTDRRFNKTIKSGLDEGKVRYFDFKIIMGKT